MNGRYYTAGNIAHDATSTGSEFHNYPFRGSIPVACDDPAPVPVFALGDYAWFDVDRDGVQDAGEDPALGVRVSLFNADGSPAEDAGGVLVASVVTDSGGRYVFDNLLAGDYYVTFTPPPGYDFTRPTAGGDRGVDSNAGTNGKSSVFTIGPSSPNMQGVTADDGTNFAVLINPTIDAGFVRQVYAVGDYVWLDQNRNGVQDRGEKPVSSVRVTLFNADGTPAKNAEGKLVSSVKTDAKGYYAFDNLLAGGYFVKFDVPSGYLVTKAKAGNDTQADSNGDEAGRSGQFILGPTETNMRATTSTDRVSKAALINPTIDLGLYRPDQWSPAGQPNQASPLAVTGSSVLSPVGVGLLLILAGVTTLVAGRRRAEACNGRSWVRR
ncbi:MAG: SdrD B-like domain-containing protein [Actinomycetota bacterium]